MSVASIKLTVDYEIFGNGSGCISSCILTPAKSIMSIAESYNAPITFFVDCSELISLEREKSTSHLVSEVKNQLIQAVKSGHDVQLHIHPQWVGANYKDNRWVVDVRRWRIGDLSQLDIESQLKEGKDWLENLIKPSAPAYRCIAFRAGGWCIQPSQKIIAALTKTGIHIDSTVAPGMNNKSQGQWFDFSTCVEKPYWHVGDEVTKEGNSELIEIPIATGRISRIRHLRALYRAKASNNGLAHGCYGSYEISGIGRSGLKNSFDKLLKLGNVMLDFSTMPSEVLIEITQNWLKRFPNSRNIPVIAIAHTKNFTKLSSSSLDEYCRWCDSQGFKFGTYSDDVNRDL
ncbi:hypothetical protein [Stutzerimonas xanthomarina]|uniref:hypothetical protein n=1 Tax=Stutzerimonas xanthomarina TaxID=271420 RepID=UPI003AA8A2AD